MPFSPEHPGRFGFTLVELLVVIAIIVLLLSMLMPATNRAIYEARLVKCAAQMKATATGIHTYTSDHQRFYPDRKFEQVNEMIPMGLGTGIKAAPESGGYDIRPELAGYVQINEQLNDPLVEAVDLEYVEDPPDTLIYCSYTLFYGWYYKHPDGGEGMFKVGDRWEWLGNTYNMLLGDYELLWTAPNDNISATHPDMFGRKPTMTPNRAQNQFVPIFTMNGTTSIYRVAGSFERASLDMNYAYDDMSVKQLRQLEVYDERYASVPHYYTGKQYDTLPNRFRHYLPR